ncbi:hypothetical protein F5Y11DRAFT_343183 [Daldinia sp. FL1419]|nr:hypothetical protein F5Y11DRAFT_343183 [Daldinia sp. FL1419]
MDSTIEATPSTAPELDTDSSAPEVAPATYHSPYYLYKNYDVAPSQVAEPPRQAEIAGLRKPTFWLLVVLFSAVALALGLGTGLGLGLRGNDGAHDTVASANSEVVNSGTSSSAQAAPPPTTSSGGRSTSISSSTDTIAIATPTAFETSQCPGRSGSVIAGKTQKYNVYCNSDLTGTDQASLVVNSLEECLTLCDSLNWTQKRQDIGCVWNEKGVVGQKVGTCWCKGGSNIKVTSLSGIVVASPAP